jgi:hypothetical protein
MEITRLKWDNLLKTGQKVFHSNFIETTERDDSKKGQSRLVTQVYTEMGSNQNGLHRNGYAETATPRCPRPP